jgi:hypothetical protein
MRIMRRATRRTGSQTGEQLALGSDWLLTAAYHATSAQATTGSEGDVESADEEQGASASHTDLY